MSIQSYFDREVDQVVRKFVAQFFSPAIKNLKDNLGDDIVSDDQVGKPQILIKTLPQSKISCRYKRFVVRYWKMQNHNISQIIFRRRPVLLHRETLQKWK